MDRIEEIKGEVKDLSRKIDDVSLRIETKLDTIKEEISGIKVLDATQNQQLAEHIKRTNLLEAEFKPVKKHVELMNFMAKLFVGTIAVGASLVAILNFIIR